MSAFPCPKCQATLKVSRSKLSFRSKYWGFPLWILTVILLCLLADSVRAESVTGLYNTGVSVSGALAADSTADPHYMLISSADKSINVPVSAFVADSSTFPFVPDGWLPDGPYSKWIDPLPDQSRGNPPGNYTYETTFQLAGGDPTSVVVSGKWSLDNIGEDILINGHSTRTYYDAPGDYSFKTYQSFVLPSNYFIDGNNTLDFVVNNTDNGNGNTPTGLRVELSAQVITPEPSSLALLGLGTIGFLSYSRKKIVGRS